MTIEGEPHYWCTRCLGFITIPHHHHDTCTQCGHPRFSHHGACRVSTGHGGHWLLGNPCGCTNNTFKADQ